MDSFFSFRISQGPHAGAAQTKTTVVGSCTAYSRATMAGGLFFLCVAFYVIARPCSAVDALLVQAHANQTGILIWHPTLHILYKQIETLFTSTIVVPQGSTRGHAEPASAVISVHLSLYPHVSVITRSIYTALDCLVCTDADLPRACVLAGRRTAGKILVTHTVRGAKRCRRHRNSLR